MTIRIGVGLILAAMFSNRAAAAEPKAYLRESSTGYYVALIADPPLTAPLNLVNVTAAVYREGEMIASTVSAPDPFGSAFVVALPGFTYGPTDLELVYRYPTGSGVAAFAIPVGLELPPKITAANPSCPELSLQFEAKAPSPYVTQRLAVLQSYVAGHVPTAQVDPRAIKGKQTRGVKYGPALGLSTLAARCFDLVPSAPTGSYDLALTFPADAPLELRPFVLKTDLSSPSHAASPLELDDKDPGKRAVEQNFDLGVQFSSSVAADESGVQQRTNQGTLDVRLAPLLNVLPTPKPGSKALWFLTPISLNAKVSTGPITKETLSTNRIVIASEVEWRHYSSSSTHPTYQRVMIGLKNASDRNFHQAEWKGTIELQPVFGVLTHPLAWEEHTEASQLDPDPDREPKHIPVIIGFGWQIVPRVGVELGKTWRNFRPEAAIEQTDTVRRVYFGGTVTLDFTRYIAMTITDTLYMRGEVDVDRQRNYLDAKVELPLPGFSNAMAQSVFVSYERGGLPPYSTPDVNALKLGYRVQWDGWFGQAR